MGSPGRIRIELTPRQARTIREITNEAGVPRHSVILGALSLLRWAAREIHEGRCIASVQGERVREFTMPLLEELRNQNP